MDLLIIAGICGALFLACYGVVTVILGIYPWHTAHLHDTREDGQPQRHLNAQGGNVARVIRVILLGLTLVCLIPFAILSDSPLYSSVIVATSFVGIRLLLLILVSILTRGPLKRTRALLLPITMGMNNLAKLYLVRMLFRANKDPFGKKNAPYSDVVGMIVSSLRLLETSHIPATNSELRMIKGILRMDRTKAKEIMQPLPDVVALSVNADAKALYKVIKEESHSKLPVYRGDLSDINNIVGILHARDLLALTAGKNGVEELEIEKVTRPAVVVNEFQTLDTLLKTFQAERTAIALVVDEHGGLAGLVTVTDLIEEIVGELMDEFDTDPPEFEMVSRDEAIADAAVLLSRTGEEFGVEMNSHNDTDVDTLGGYIFGKLGRVPHVKDRVNYGDLQLTVTKMIGRRISRVQIKNTHNSEIR